MILSALPVIAMDRSSRRFDAQGFLHVDACPISKAQIRTYYGREIPGWQSLGLDATRTYRMYCSAEELAKGAATFNNLPILSEHIAIDADNIPDHLIVGTMGNDCAFDGTYLRGGQTIWKRPAITGIVQDRKRENSCGYAYTADMTPGNFGGMPYDGAMLNIVGNHVTLVIEGRAGPDVKVGDEDTMKSRTALMLSGAIAAMVRPLLAADAKVDLTPALKDVTGAGLSDKSLGMDAAIAAAVVEAVTPALADGQTITADAVLATIASVPIAEDDALGTLAPKPPVVKIDTRTDPVVPPVQVAGLDAAAVDERVRVAADAARASALAESAAIRTAEREVFPFVGEVVAMDSAAAVYKVALDHLKVDLTGVPETAYGAVLRTQPKPGATDPAIVTTALDAGAAKSFKERFPNASVLVRS
jgi:hypothetical protein